MTSRTAGKSGLFWCPGKGNEIGKHRVSLSHTIQEQDLIH